VTKQQVTSALSQAPPQVTNNFIFNYQINLIYLLVTLKKLNTSKKNG